MRLKPTIEHGYVLMNPSGRPVPETFDTDRWTAWCYAFDYISARFGEDWRVRFWKKPEESEKDAAKRGWWLTKCVLCTRQEFNFPHAKAKK